MKDWDLAASQMCQQYFRLKGTNAVNSSAHILWKLNKHEDAGTAAWQITRNLPKFCTSF